MILAVQLYTLRDELKLDFKGTLKKVAELGYKGVEFAGFYDIPALEMKQLLDELSLVPVGSHTGLDLLEQDFNNVVKYNEIIGNKNIVIPSAPMRTIADLNKTSERLMILEKKLVAEGLLLHYHNHDFEFAMEKNEYLLDLLYQKVGNLYPEIDTHWVQRANVNPIDYVKKYQKRLKLVHLKDLVVNNGKMEFAPLGKGIMKIKEIISVVSGAYALIVENDLPQNGGLKDIEISINYLKEVGL